MVLTHDSLPADPISGRSGEPAKSRSFVVVNVALAVGIAALTLVWAAVLVRTLMWLVSH
jgi:hypothetical protein